MQELKDKLTPTPVLVPSKGIEEYAVYCDVVKVGVGCVYMRHDNVKAYALRQLRPHKRTYPTCDFELTVATIAYSRWHHYLYKTSGERIIMSKVAEFSLVSEIKGKSNV